VAHLYDDTRRTPQLVTERGFPAILAAAGPGARILDVGTGTGRLAVPLLALGADLIGLDLSWEMMARQRAKTAAARLVQGSALALPFGDGRFDALLTAHVLHLIAAWPAARVIILTTFDRDDYVYQGIRAGALGYLLKDAPADELVRTIRRVHAGEAFIQPEIASRALREILRPKESPLEPLSEREREVLLLLAQGASTATSPTGWSSARARSRTTSRTSSASCRPPTGPKRPNWPGATG
jgi:DNA-binding NarL/FixJ family response regulator